MRDNGLWQDKPFAKGQAWIDLLMSASHKAHSFWVRDIEIKVGVGQVAMSEITMSKNWGWSRNKVRRFLSYLENAGKIEQQKNNVTTLITIVNWKSYQQTKQQTIQQKDSNETPNDTQSKNEEELNNEKKETKGRFAPPSIEEVGEYANHLNYDIDPEEFWHHHNQNGWKLKGGRMMVSWQSAVVTWNKNQKKFNSGKKPNRKHSFFTEEQMGR
jgi:hypothetical protein